MKIFGPKMEEIKGNWREQYSGNLISCTQLIGCYYGGHIDGNMTRNAYNISDRKPEGKRPLERQ